LYAVFAVVAATGVWLRIARSATSGDLVHVVLGMEDGDNPIDGGESVWRLSHLSAR
jgi:hypothetical protein